jgi:hypothetical protein
MHIRFHVKYPLFLSDFNETKICSHWEPSCSTRTNGRTHGKTDGRKDKQTTDKTKLAVAFRDFGSAPKNSLKAEVRCRI